MIKENFVVIKNIICNILARRQVLAARRFSGSQFNRCTQTFFARKQVYELAHAPYSGNFVLCHYFLFPKLKIPLKGRCFHGINNITKLRDMLFACYSKTGHTEVVPKYHMNVKPAVSKLND